MRMANAPEDVNNANVKVVVRIRPLVSAEYDNKYETVAEAISDHMLVFDPKVHHVEGFLETHRRGITGRRFKDLKYAFDHVLKSTSRNKDVFEKTTQSIVKAVLSGYNCSVFAYGATGSGKTHTMLGNEHEPGVIYHTMLDLYRQIDELKTEKIFNVAVSYLEIYNETVRDLFNPIKNLPIREDKMAGVMIAGLSLHKPNDADELIRMLHAGNKNRSQHPTDANAESSRSHAVFQVFVKMRSRNASEKSQFQMAKMCLVDLAGSERAIHSRNEGARFREGANINRSLLALGNVINALASKAKGHVPYRDSKLTRLLKDSLGGNCQTVMIATISPSSRSYEDTYNTLRYADRAKHIKADLTKNVVNVDQHIVSYKVYVADLEKENRELREKTKKLQETSVLSTSNNSITPAVKQLQDRIFELFKQRKELMRTRITSEVIKRELKWKLSRKERCIKRVEKLTGQKSVVNKHQRVVERMDRRYRKEEVNLQKAAQQLRYHDQSIYDLNTELPNVGFDKPSKEMLAMMLRFFVTDSYLHDLDMHLCFVKKMARAQERQANVNESLILSLIQLVRKQQETLRQNNMITPALENEYKECCYKVEERGVAWVQQQSDKTSPEATGDTNKDSPLQTEVNDPKEDLCISDIIDIQVPKIDLNALKVGNVLATAVTNKETEVQPAPDKVPVPQRVRKQAWQSPTPPQRPDIAGWSKHQMNNLGTDSLTLRAKTAIIKPSPLRNSSQSEIRTSSMSASKIRLLSQKNSAPQLLPSHTKSDTVGGGGNKIEKDGDISKNHNIGGEKDKKNGTTELPESKASTSLDEMQVGNVKRMVEKYTRETLNASASGPSEESIPLNNGSSTLSNLTDNLSEMGKKGCKRTLYGDSLAKSKGVTKTATPRLNTLHEGQVTPLNKDTDKVLNQVLINACSPNLESKDENTPTSDKLNNTFEIEKPAIPNTPCIDGPVLKQRRVANSNSYIISSNTATMPNLTNTSRNCNSRNLDQSTLKLKQALLSSTDHKLKAGRLSSSNPSDSKLVTSTSNNINTISSTSNNINTISSTSNNINTTSSTSNNIKTSPSTAIVDLSSMSPTTTTEEASTPLFSKTRLSQELEKLNKYSKLRSLSPSGLRSLAQGVTAARVSPSVNKWELIKDKGMRSSKLWKSHSAQQINASNNCSLSEDDYNQVKQDVFLQDADEVLNPLKDSTVKTSTPKMEVEVCYINSSKSSSVPTTSIESKVMKTPEFKINPYMQTVIQSLKKHGLPSLTESMVKGNIRKSQDENPNMTPCKALFGPKYRDRSPLRLLDVNTNKYDSKRDGTPKQFSPEEKFKVELVSLVPPNISMMLPPTQLFYPTMTAQNIFTDNGMKHRPDKGKERRLQRDIFAKPYSRTQKTVAGHALRSDKSKEVLDTQDDKGGTNPSIAVTKPSYMLSTFAASQRKNGHGKTKTKLLPWETSTSNLQSQRRPLVIHRNKSALPWLN